MTAPPARLAGPAAATPVAVLVVVLVVVLAGLAPGLAGAQPSPAPLPADFPVPVDDGRPDHRYVQTVGCVTRAPAGPAAAVAEPWGQALLRFDEVAELATGRGQTVAVIDTGVSPHRYLAGRLAGGGDYVVESDRGLSDCDGHGTQVAGIIAAAPPAGVGFRGIAPGARILSIRQSSRRYTVDNSALGRRLSAGNLATLAKAIRRAADSGATVINMSLDHCRRAVAPVTGVERQVQAALRYAVEERDVVAVAAAGNLNGSDCTEQNGARPTQVVIPPWFADHVISVAAVTEDGAPAPFSMHGPWVTVAAPGTGITTLDPADPTRLVDRVADTGAELRGTSFAAPYVAGLAALVRERHPGLTAAQVRHRIVATAAHPAGADGWDPRVGHGVVDPVAALTAVVPDEFPPAAGAAPRDWRAVAAALTGAVGTVALVVATLLALRLVRTRRSSTP